MAITKKPTQLTATTHTFINGAPDAPRHVRKGRKIQITFTITEPLLARIDEMANQLGQSRASLINLSLIQMLENGLRIESGK